MGRVSCVAPGIWWARLPIALSMDHVNVYFLQDEAGWVLVDSGCATVACGDALEAAIESLPGDSTQIKRVIVTHFHPDHVGLAGHLCGLGAELLTTEGCWRSTRVLRLENRETPHPNDVTFMRRAGMDGIELDAFKRRSPSNYSRHVMALPVEYTRVAELDRIQIGNREWTVKIGGGHADDHLTLWSGDDVAIVGDQILPNVSPNVTVHYTKPAADPVADWLDSCDKFADVSRDSTLCLPGHGVPFRGAPSRCAQMKRNSQLMLSRLEDRLSRPATAVDVMPALYRRVLKSNERKMYIAETVAYLNCLYRSGAISRREKSSGAYLWRRVKASASKTSISIDKQMNRATEIAKDERVAQK